MGPGAGTYTSEAECLLYCGGTPAPTTPSPTAAPVTPSPVTPAPTTPAPTTPSPVTPSPIAYLYYRVEDCCTNEEIFVRTTTPMTIGSVYDLTGIGDYATVISSEGGPGYDLDITPELVGAGGCANAQCAACPTPAPVTPAPVTPAPTPAEFYEFTGCGRGENDSEACNDAGINNRTFYSNCDIIGGGCYVYVDTFGNPLTGYTHLFMAGSNWYINSSTGQITGYSLNQC